MFEIIRNILSSWDIGILGHIGILGLSWWYRWTIV